LRTEQLSTGNRNPVYERWRWQVFIVTWITYAGFNLTRNSFAVTKIAIGEGSEVGLTHAQMAWVDDAFLVAYAAGQLLCGVAGDRFGARKVVLAGILLSVAAGVAMGACSSVTAFATCFFLQGLSQSSGWAPLLKNVGNFFSQRERGFILGLWCTNYTLGGLFASIYAGYVGQQWGWRMAYFIPAASLLAIWVLFFLFQRDRPQDVGLEPIEMYHGEPAPVVKRGDAPADEPEGSWQTILRVATNPMVGLLSLVYFFLKPARYALLFWGPKYLNDRLGTGMEESSFLSAMFEFAGPFAVLAAGWSSDKWFGSRRLPVSIISLALLSLVLAFVDRVPHTRWMLGTSLFLLGFLTYAPESLVSGVAAVDFGTRKGASTASGLINAIGSIGAVVGITIIGMYQKTLGWHGVFRILAVAVACSAVLLLPKWNALPPMPANNADSGKARGDSEQRAQSLKPPHTG
jgi:OPA family sugar phosphate sensor protein UhpC-like MFS transporter